MSFTDPGRIQSEAPLAYEDTQVAFAYRSTWEMLKAYLLFWSFSHAWMVRLGSRVTSWVLRLRIPGLFTLVKRTLFTQFCGGETIQECEQVVNTLGKNGVFSILDYSVEGEKSDAGFDATLKETIATLDYAKGHPHVAFGVFKMTGLVRLGLMEKLSAKEALSPSEWAEWERAKARIMTLCQHVSDVKGQLFIDAEESWIQGLIDTTAEEMMAAFNRERPVIFNTYQLYRTEALRNLGDALERARIRGFWFGAKLVRGAYMERERARAKQLGYPDPIQRDKASTDRDYNQAVALCLDHLDRVAICAGTHNDESCLRLSKEMAERRIEKSDRRIFFSQLYGMSDHLSFNLAKEGYNVAKYLPYGPVTAVLPYLIRRAEENSAIAGQGGREFRLVQRELKRRRSR